MSVDVHLLRVILDSIDSTGEIPKTLTDDLQQLEDVQSLGQHRNEVLPLLL